MITLDDIAKRLERLERATLLNKAVLDVKEAAMLTGYSVKYMRLLIAQHEVPYYRRGNRLFFNRSELEDWMLNERYPSNEEIKRRAIIIKH
jgi:excisionase family DNA binding protein